MRRNRGFGDVVDAKDWVIAAIKREARRSPKRLWEGEPTAQELLLEKFRRIKFLRKYADMNREPTTLRSVSTSAPKDIRVAQVPARNVGGYFSGRGFAKAEK